MAILALIVLLLPLPWLLPSYLGQLIFMGIHTLAVLGLTLLMGYAGQISLAQAAFFGLGAYGSMVMTMLWGLDPWLGMLATAVLVSLVALLIGIPTLRLQGHYLALATLGLGIIVYIIFNEETAVTGGPSGAIGIPHLRLFGATLSRDWQYYYVVWSIVLLALAAAGNLARSSYGRVLRALGASEVAAEATGVDTARYKLQTFIACALLASLAGSLYAHYLTTISPTAFGFDISIEFLVMAVVGGLGNVWGAFLGAAAVTIVLEALRLVAPKLVPGVGAEIEVVFFGAILVLTMIFLPEGLVGLLTRRTRERHAVGS